MILCSPSQPRSTIPEPTNEPPQEQKTVQMSRADRLAAKLDLGDARTVPPKLGPYCIERELGRGGMGVVYAALDTRLHRRVAIKMLPDGLTNDQHASDKLENEARLLASLNHPNIATIYSLENIDGFRFFTLELIVGERLTDLTGRSLAVTLNVFRQIAGALSVAHDTGVIHCDLKPANILVAARETPKILDFGIARAVGRGPTSAKDDIGPSGTPGYMSPEQILGRPPDHRVDIWAFGCLLHEVLTGSRAFSGETMDEVLTATLNDAPDLLPASLPEKVRDLVARCLEKDPSRRLDSMSGAARVLEGAASSFRWRQAHEVGETLRGALDVGDQAVDFELRSGDGDKISSAKLLAKGALVISFYRGRWCPDCTSELVSFQRLHDEIASLGATMIAISPQLEEHNKSIAKEQDLTYHLLSDPGNEVARSYGVALALPRDLREFHRNLGLDLEHFNGDDSWVLPIPATFVVGADGVVHYSATSPDPTRRPDPQLAIQALRKLRG